MSASSFAVRSGGTRETRPGQAARQTAWVSGASGGLGRAFAAMLLEEGYEVWGTSRDPARLAEWARQARFRPVVLDLADPIGAERAFLEAQRAAGGAFDVCVQNAGAGEFAAFAATDADRWERHVGGLLLTTARLSRLALQGFGTRRPVFGSLVHVSSLAAEFPLPLMSSYNVAKAGLSALSESLIFETRGSGVTVIDFRPGDYRTSFNQTMQATAIIDDERQRRLWLTLERNLAAGPAPERAARDLRRALRRGRSGVVRSGSLFQAVIGPFLARLGSQGLRRAFMARYFGAR